MVTKCKLCKWGGVLPYVTRPCTDKGKQRTPCGDKVKCNSEYKQEEVDTLLNSEVHVCIKLEYMGNSA